MDAEERSAALDQLAQQLRISIQDPKAGEIFHYTSMEGFYHIVRNSQLFLTDAAFLNDATEAENVAEQLDQALQACKGDLEQKLYQGLLRQIRNGSLVRPGRQGRESIRSFVLACSYQKDSLHLWNYYGRNPDHSAGICLGFDQQELERSFRILNQEQYLGDLTLACGKVIYQDTVKQELLTALLLGAQTLWDQGDARAHRDCLYRLTELIRWVGIFFKHQCFATEEEYRIVADLPESRLLSYVNLDRCPIPEQLYKVRLQNQLFAPYIKLVFEPDGIREVRLSPLSDRFEARSLEPGDIQVYGVSQFMKVNGIQMQPDQIRRSEIPLRY